jgi:CRP/FNR family transcriptional regulator
MEELPFEDLKMIDRLAPMHVISKGTIIFSPERPPKGLFLLKKGKVRLYRINPEGKELTLAILGDGNFFGEVETFSTGTRHVYALAMEDTMLCVLSKEDFEMFMQERPQLALKMIRVLSERLWEAEEMLEKLAYGSLQKRLLFLLSKLGQNFGKPDGEYLRLHIALSHQDLAAMIGATREAVSATMANLARKGIVKKGLGRKTIWIHPALIEEELRSQGE